jgi:hypothetical protein
MKRRLFVLLSMVLGCMLAHAAPAHIELAVPQARLAGSGTFTYFTMKIYSAQLWVGERGYAPAVPFALDLRYARKLQGKKIAEASFDQMAKIGAGSAGQRTAWLQLMTAIFPDVQEGSHLTGVFVPDEGARFYLDGKPLANVSDLDFARAFFAIWLDPATTAPALRQALLERAGPRLVGPRSVGPRSAGPREAEPP